MMVLLRVLLRSLCILLVLPIVPTGARGQVIVGADHLLQDYFGMVEGKRIALVTNHTARLTSGEHLLDGLLRKGSTIMRVFTPEHGIRGTLAGGQAVRDTVDPATGISLVSLYGAIRKPGRDLLKDVDILLYDIQDVGARFYTYISTMVLCMEAAAEQGVPFVVLDRPNPLGGTRVDGPILEDSLRSFVGIIPVPVAYGLTAGELARLVNEEGMLAGGARANLIVIPMTGWRRGMTWSETSLPWVPPSPNMPTPATAIVYPSTCFLEATNVSEGRGTAYPFEMIGAPFIDGDALARRMNALNLHGVRFDTASFTPAASKYRGEVCRGVRVEVVDPEKFEPVLAGVCLIQLLRKMYPTDFQLRRPWFVKLMGSSRVLDLLLSDVDAREIEESWKRSTGIFARSCGRYMLYSGKPLKLL